jgi:1-acyl-sn-glycerol-3-phosphate acyltransferase
MECGSAARAILRLIPYLAITVIGCVLQFIGLVFRLPYAKRLPRYYHRLCARLLGLDIMVIGKRSKVRPTLFVANHTSYLDIPVLGAVLNASFIAKSEVADWPFFGTLAKLQQTVFVDRKPTHAAKHSDDIKSRLLKGDNLILFPEGTNSDGNRTLPFKTSLFSVTSLRVKTRRGERPITVQPISVTCVALDGIPVGRFLRPIYSWFGDTALVPHLWQFLKLGRVTVVVEFHEPVDLETLGSRKAVAEHCWQAVSDGVADAVAGYAYTRRRRKFFIGRRQKDYARKADHAAA